MEQSPTQVKPGPDADHADAGAAEGPAPFAPAEASEGVASARAPSAPQPRGGRDDDEVVSGLLTRVLERLGRRYGITRLVQLAKNRGDIRRTFAALPDRMHKLANQTQLILELVDDYRTGVYRAIPWRSILVLAGIVAYLVSPIDVIPDVLSAVGVLDDMILIAFANRLMRHDLEAYCEFKGYALDEYF